METQFGGSGTRLNQQQTNQISMKEGKNMRALITILIIIAIAVIFAFNIAMDDLMAEPEASNNASEVVQHGIPLVTITHQIDGFPDPMVALEVHDMAIQRLADGKEVSDPLLEHMVKILPKRDAQFIYRKYKGRSWAEWSGWSKDTTIEDVYSSFQ